MRQARAGSAAEVGMAVVFWVNRWSRAFPDPAWEQLRERLVLLSKSKPLAGPAAISRWCRANPSISAKIDAEIDRERAFDVASRAKREEPPPGRFNRAVQRKERAE